MGGTTIFWKHPYQKNPKKKHPTSTASENMPRCMFAKAFPVCSKTEPEPESSVGSAAATGGASNEQPKWAIFLGNKKPAGEIKIENF